MTVLPHALLKLVSSEGLLHCTAYLNRLHVGHKKWERVRKTCLMMFLKLPALQLMILLEMQQEILDFFSVDTFKQEDLFVVAAIL